MVKTREFRVNITIFGKLNGRPRLSLWSSNTQGPLEIGGELAKGSRDFWRLVNQRCKHSLGHLRLAPHQFHRRHNERQRIIDVMSHRCQLLVQLVELFNGQSDRLTGQTHLQQCAEREQKRKWYVGREEQFWRIWETRRLQSRKGGVESRF